MMVVVPVVRWGDDADAASARPVLVTVVVAGGKVGPSSFSFWFQRAGMRMMMRTV